MKRIPIILIILIILINFSSCEKDDICVDGDTPLLIIGFYDITDTTFKQVSSLRIISLDNNSIYSSDTFADQSAVSDSIFLPLQIEDVTSTYQFILDSDGDNDGLDETGNSDTLGFSYTPGEEFISRGCGFVANYNGLDTIRTVTTDDWILGLNIVEDSISNNTQTIHVQIFH